MMSDDVRDLLADSYPAEDVVAPPVGDLWARGRRQRRRRTMGQAAGVSASIVLLAGVGAMYGLPAALPGPTPAPQIGSDDLPAPEGEIDPEGGDGVDGPRWEVCDYADFADAKIDASSNWERNIATACEQVRAGHQPDRPDIVACYSRTDEPGGRSAGEIATELCDRLAARDAPIPVDEVDNLARSRPYGDREAALSGWQPTSPPPDALQLLAADPGETAWYASEDATTPESWLAHGLAAWDDRLGADADAVCAWIVEEIAAMVDDGAEAVSIVLNSTLEGTVGDGLTPIILERCGQ